MLQIRVCSVGPSLLADFSMTLRRIAIRKIFVLRGDMVRNMFGIVPNAPDETGATTRQPRQTQKIDARFGRNAALMPRLTLCIQSVDIQPTVVNGIARCPYDRGDTRRGQI